MRYCVLLVLLLLLYSCEFEGVRRPEPDGHMQDTISKLIISPEKIDFGIVNRTEVPKLSRIVYLRNLGNKPIVIQKVDVSCGCITGTLSSGIILPDSQQQLNISVNITKQNGYFNKTIFINSSASNKLELLRIKGEIK